MTAAVFAVLPLAAGCVLDLLLGDPRTFPHPVVALGRLIAWLETILRSRFSATPKGEYAAGLCLVMVVTATAFFLPLFVLAACYRLHSSFGIILESFVCYQVLAAKGLRDAAMRVWTRLQAGDIPGSRQAVAEIVGRDTDSLGADGVTRATVETVAENSSDGVIAPMLFFALGGAPLALLYKAINTMDSMLGYTNARYLHFGRAAARLDDAANYFPARLTAALTIPAAFLCGCDWRGAWHTIVRDGRKHSSPNAGVPEAAFAGALGVRLGGSSTYGGRLVEKPEIGDDHRPVEPDDIIRACRLLYVMAGTGLCVCAGLAAVLASLPGQYGGG